MIKTYATVLRYAVLLLIAGLLGVGCNSKSKNADISMAETDSLNKVHDLADIVASGKLRAIVANSSSSYYIYRGQPMGYEYELLKMLADSLNVELELVVAQDLDEIFDMMQNQEADILAAHLTVTRSRSELVAFTYHHATTRQVLVQRKPADYMRLHPSQIDKKVIRNQINLIGKTVYVRKNSSYFDRLHNLSDEIGGEIKVETVMGDVETEELIQMVAEGVIDYTVADEHLARLNALYHRNLDVKTPISFPQKIAWAVNKDAENLLKRINQWLTNTKKTVAFNHIRQKYFSASKGQLARLESDFNSESGGKLSEYDDILKKYARELPWDWRLLASLVYQESRFKNQVVSWAGAKGLMQLMPNTAKRFGVDLSTNFSPEQSVKAGVGYLKWLDAFWQKHVPDSAERIKFILASYNAGHGHVLDAWRLAEKHDADPTIWEDNTESFLLKKSLKKYYRDEVVENGYCRCKQPVLYVNEILQRFAMYREMIPLESQEKPDNLSYLLQNNR